MPFSLMNGLSSLGAGVAEYAGRAGLEQQRADLQRQSIILADQLATTRETAGREQAGQIAATAAGIQQTHESGEHALDRSARSADIATTEAGSDRRQVVTEAGADRRLDVSEKSAAERQKTSEAGADRRLDVTEKGSTDRQKTSEAGADRRLDVTEKGSTDRLGISEDNANKRAAASVAVQYAQIAAGDEVRAQEVLASRAKVAFEKVQTENAQALQTLHTALADESGKPDADPARIASLTTQITSREKSAATEAATNSAAAAMYRTDMDAVQHYNTQLVTATAALNSPEMTDTDRTAQKGLIADLKRQLAGAQRAMQYSSELMHGRIGSQTGNVPPSSGGNRPPLSSFGGAQRPLPNPKAGPRAVPAPSIPGFLDGGY